MAKVLPFSKHIYVCWGDIYDSVNGLTIYYAAFNRFGVILIHIIFRADCIMRITPCLQFVYLLTEIASHGGCFG